MFTREETEACMNEGRHLVEVPGELGERVTRVLSNDRDITRVAQELHALMEAKARESRIAMNDLWRDLIAEYGLDTETFIYAIRINADADSSPEAGGRPVIVVTGRINNQEPDPSVGGEGLEQFLAMLNGRR